MVTATRWLRWNGVYDLAGICNRKLTPLDSPAEQLKALKERLYLLGFDCGALDNNPSNESKDALVTFNCYFNHDTIRKWVPLPPPMPGQLVVVPPKPVPAAPYYDANTIKALKDIEDEIPVPSPRSKAAREHRRTLSASRSRYEKSGGVDFTLNDFAPIAVKIVSVPKSIKPFAEFGAIEVEIRGYEFIKSLMIRIYRNFDPATDANAVPGERMVYQEILDADGVAELPDAEFDENKGKHKPAKAYIMRQVIGGGMTGSFGNYLGVAYERLHAPYKIRVWASTKNKFFDEYAFQPSGAAKSRKIIKSENPSLHYLDEDHREEVRRTRNKFLALVGAPREEVHLIEPVINHIDTVHDKSNIAKTDKSEPVRFHWKELEKSNAAIKRAKYWTEKDENGINLTAEKCDTHPVRFLLDNQIEDEAIVKIFAKDPIGVYWELRNRLDADENFQFTELAEVFGNVGRHINILRRRLCCGQWSHVDEAIKNDALATLTYIENEAANLKGRSYPYNDSLIFLNSFVSVVSYVIHKAVVQQELEFYLNNDLRKAAHPVPAPGSTAFDGYLRDRRNNIDGCRSTATSEYGMTAGHNFASKTQSRPFFDVLGGYFSYLKTKEGIAEWMDYKTRQIGKAILLPSYNPLDAYFFVQIRAVPMYLVGMLDMQYLNADGIRQIPVGFFEHDCFHVASPNSSGGGTQQWRTLYRRLTHVIDASAPPNKLTERMVYDRWQANVRGIEQAWLSTQATSGRLWAFCFSGCSTNRRAVLKISRISW